MPLRLSDADLRGIREFQDLLATPLRFPSPEAWIEAIQHAGTDLFDVPRSAAMYPGPDGPLIDSPNLAPETLDGLTRAIVGTESERNRYRDPHLDRVMGRLVATGTRIWNQEIVERVGRIRIERMPRFYPEVIRPGRLEGITMMGASLPNGRAMFGIVPEDAHGTKFGEDTLEVFRLLHPAFKAGCWALARGRRRWRQLGESLDLLEEGVAVCRDGVHVYRNRALRRLLGRDEGRENVLEQVDACAEALQRSLAGPTPFDVAENASALVETEEDRYRIEASLLDAGVAGTPATVLVVVRPARPVLPGEGELRERYGLTPRQAEVALLLARGRSNREIAERLEISPHTARHHAQRVLEKVGAESRKALALLFLTDRRSEA